MRIIIFNCSLIISVKDVARFINQLKRDDENLRSVQDVQESLSSELDIQLVNFGHLLKDGELLIKVSDQPPKKRYCILCVMVISVLELAVNIHAVFRQTALLYVTTEP